MALSSAIEIEELPVDGRGVVIPHRGFEETGGQIQTGSTIDGNTERGTEILKAIKNGQFNPARHQEALEPSTASRPAALPSSPVFEALYGRLGRWSGRYGSRQAQQDVLRGWIQTGEDGASWLVRRVTEERNLEALDGVSIALEAMSTVAAPHIIASLATSTASGDVETVLKLFRILEWFPAEDIVALGPSLTAIVERSASHPSVELREAAYRCIPLLPSGEDVRMRVLAIETDSELRDLLQQPNG
jgi:hypothetical protein